MRHRVKIKTLNKYASHRIAMFRNIAREVFEHGTIITTVPKAKAARILIEKIITKAKKGDVWSRRLIDRDLHDRRLTNKVVEEIAPKFKNRDGGYTRILKLGKRKGDGAEMAILQLLEVEEEK